MKLYFILVYLFTIQLINADFRKNVWQKTDYIWDFGIISSCTIGPEQTPIDYFKQDNHPFNPSHYKNIQTGDVVWLRGRQVNQFAALVLPTVKNPFVLVISDGDESFPSECFSNKAAMEQFLNNKNIIHVFAQNCDYTGKHPKLSHLPIGLDFHTIGYKDANGGWGEKGTPVDQERVLKDILSGLKPTHARIKMAFVDFHLADTMHGENRRYLQFGEDRKAIFERLKLTGLIDYCTNFMRRSDLWKTKGQYAFSVSPHGNGLDCHRTWEDLILGCIVIVKTSPLDPLYAGLPVVIVKDWSEITPHNLDIWISQYADAFTNPYYRRKLTNSYWLKKIFKKATMAKKR